MDKVTSTPWLRVSDIKQYCFCRRVPYYYYVLPVPKRISYKMQAGKDKQDELQRKEARRTLARYGLADGQRVWNVSLDSDALRLRGKLDLLIRSSTDHYPVEIKSTLREFATGHKYQLTAYCLLVEEAYGGRVDVGYLYAPPKRIKRQQITAGMRRYTLRLLKMVRNLLQEERLPPGSRNTGRCLNCEFKKYCADRL